MANSASRSPNPSVDMRPVSEGMSPMPKEALNKSKKQWGCHSGEGDPQEVENVARGQGVRSDQNPVKTIVYWMLVFTSMTAKILNQSFPKPYSCIFFRGEQCLLPALVLCLLFAHGVRAEEEATEEDTLAAMDGRQIMDEVYRRHQQYPYIYEEQSMVMEDSAGNRDTRKLIRYSRSEDDGTIRFMVIFQYPREVKGVALLANRNPDGTVLKSVYLPALGPKLFESSATGSSGSLLGSDFSIENLTGEVLDDYQYLRRPDMTMDNTSHFLVDVFPAGVDLGKDSALRRHYVRKDNFFIIRTDHYDRNARIYKQQSMHDLKQIDGDMWSADMTLMVDQRSRHQTLLKVDRRVFSRDYVPAEMFTADWLFANYPDLQRTDEAPADPGKSGEDGESTDPSPGQDAGDDAGLNAGGAAAI